MATEFQKVQKPVRFGGNLELDPRAYELRRSGRPLKIEPTPMAILSLLIERRGELVTREEIVQRIWGAGVYVDTDNSINGAIRKIRQVLDDDPCKPLFIQTVSGKGYRFVARVSADEEVKPAPAVASPTAPVEFAGGGPAWRRSKWVPIVAGAACIVVITAVIGYSGRIVLRRQLNNSLAAADSAQP